MSATAETEVSPERVRAILAEQEERAAAKAQARALLDAQRQEEPESPEEIADHERRDAEAKHRERIKRLKALAADRGLYLHSEGTPTIRRSTFALEAISGHHNGRPNAPIVQAVGTRLTLDEVERYLTETDPPSTFEVMRARELLHAEPGAQEAAERAAEQEYRSITSPR